MGWLGSAIEIDRGGLFDKIRLIYIYTSCAVHTCHACGRDSRRYQRHFVAVTPKLLAEMENFHNVSTQTTNDPTKFNENVSVCSFCSLSIRRSFPYPNPFGLCEITALLFTLRTSHSRKHVYLHVRFYHHHMHCCRVCGRTTTTHKNERQPVRGKQIKQKIIVAHMSPFRPRTKKKERKRDRYYFMDFVI